MSENETEEKRFVGIAASPGVAHGPAFVFLRQELEVPKRTVPPERREEEIARFEQGLLETRRQISAIRAEIEEKLGEDEAAIFDAHQLVLEDRALIEETIKEVLESGLNIEYCFQQVANRYIEAFSRIDDEYLKERMSDIRDVSRRLLSTLLGRQDVHLKEMGNERILVADDLTPSDTVNLSSQHVLAVVTEQASRTTHAVIMARSMGVPCVVGQAGITRKVATGDAVLVDGFGGMVIHNPTDDTLYQYGKIQSERETIERRFRETAHFPAVSRDGRAIKVLLNIEGYEDPWHLKNVGADGVGLFRTESLFLSSERFEDEEAQFETYRNVAQAMAPNPVTIRTLDLGGDKNPHNSLYGYTEANPFMGFRAIRFCLEHREVFKVQLRAILRASAFGNVRVMYPMISSVSELHTANEVLKECMAELEGKGVAFDQSIKRGCMIEIPSAAVITDLLAPESDFFSIGTNDLIQYMLAVDRVNDRIAHLFQPSHPAVLRALNFIFEAGEQERIPVSVCGEMAGDPVYAPLLFGLGANELSLTAPLVPEVKFLLRAISFRDVRRLSLDLLRETDPRVVEERLEAFHSESMRRALEQM